MTYMKVEKFSDEIYVIFDISNNDARFIINWAYIYIKILLVSSFKYLKFFLSLFFLFYVKISVYDDYKDISLYYQLYMFYSINQTRFLR